MASGRLTLVIEVEGYDNQTRAVDVSLKMSSQMRKKITQWMIDRIRTRVQAGLDVAGKPFAPRKDGSPATLSRSGAMLAGIQPAKSSDISAVSKTKSLAQVGVTDVVNGDPNIRYPYYLQNGSDPERVKARKLKQLRDRLTKKQNRLARKMQEMSEIRGWSDERVQLYNAIEGVKSDISEIRAQIQDVESRTFSTLPAREWWGLTSSERATLEQALADWVHAMIDGAVGAACNPEAEPPDKVSARVDSEILKRFT